MSSAHEFVIPESGTIVTADEAAPRPIRAAWSPILHFDDHANIDWAAVTASGGLPFTVGPDIAQSFGFSINPCINDDDRNAALDSLRRSIDRKQRQCDPTLPHFVVLSSTFLQIAVSGTEFANTWDVFGTLFEGRIPFIVATRRCLMGRLPVWPRRRGAVRSGLRGWPSSESCEAGR
jgi:hypothetical protein